MGWPARNALPLIAACALCGCAPHAATFAQAASACAGNARFVEVEGTGTVVRVLGERDSRSGMHEGFLLRVGARTVKVEDNVSITGPIPLAPGDAIALRGQYECDDGVVHWTHHDPRGRHRNGYIEVHGTRYQ